jgi:hypothetical protein
MQRASIERLLPEVFRATLAGGSPLGAVLDVMEGMHALDERVLDSLDEYFDPARTEDRFVPMLARWVDLERLFVRSAAPGTKGGAGTRQVAAAVTGEPIATGTGRLRELVARAAFLSQWRGTHTGLVAFLETATGARGFTIDEAVPAAAQRRRPFHIRVHAPSSVQVHRALIERIIKFEKPAYVTYELDFTNLGAES